jgi:glycosyltransferase involved in cell wall biosynthesis
MHYPIDELGRRGHDVQVSSVLPDEWRDTADVIVGQRVCLPGPTSGWQQMVKEGRAKLVLEVDDDLFSTHPTSTIAHGFFSRPEIQANLKSNIQVAHLVTVTTEALAERIRPLNPNVAILPNCIPQALLDHTPQRRDDVVTVGWAGSPTHQIDWHRNAEPIARVIKRHPEAEMHLMGWAPDRLCQLLPENRRRFTGWIASVDELHRAIDYHIGVVPLWNNTFNVAKSDVKLLELSALGIPAVCSDVGPYRLSGPSASARMVRSGNDWARHLTALIADEAARKEQGEAAKEWAATRTVEGNIHLWEQADP